jgi:hypothetical protein
VALALIISMASGLEHFVEIYCVDIKVRILSVLGGSVSELEEVRAIYLYDGLIDIFISALMVYILIAMRKGGCKKEES